MPGKCTSLRSHPFVFMSYLPSENSKSDNVKFKHSFLLHSNGAWIRLLDGASRSRLKRNTSPAEPGWAR
jgi:hypothetical protein